ncbi:MAG: hypothetical protein HY423_06675 [Candidatus Lambdaproteobacteria bacterium]|nr:hypothetical protein [Candidatus Lambdaproteobacteria bacterium]
MTRRRWTVLLPFLKGFGTVVGLAGAILIALHVPASGWGWPLVLASSSAWALVAYALGERSLLLLQLGFTVVNAIGVWRWLLVAG